MRVVEAIQGFALQWPSGRGGATIMPYPNPPLHFDPQIRFSTKSFGRDAAAAAARAIAAVAHQLVDADISDVIAGRPVSTTYVGLDAFWQCVEGLAGV